MNQKSRTQNKVTKINKAKPKLITHIIQPIQNHSYTNLYTKHKLDNIIVSFSF